MKTLTKSKVHDKIFLVDDLANKVQEMQRRGQKVVQSHGIFDLIHPGVIAHLNSAKKQGDILIVTVIKDKDVRKGPGRPIFPDKLRLENVASLEQVDYVSLVEDEPPFDCVQLIKPDIFARGQTFSERDRHIHVQLFQEKGEIYFGKSKVHETQGFTMSSSHIVKEFLDIYPEDTKKFLSGFSRKYRFSDIVRAIELLKDLKVLLIGDGIIDEYYYCLPMGRAAKSPIVVQKYISHEVFSGGAFAIANHLSSICDNVHLISLLGREDSKENFIYSCMKSNVKTKFFFREGSPAIVKRRYIDQYRNQKLFEVDYVNDGYISNHLESEIIKYLKSTMMSYDIVLVSDFGHGLITKRIIDTIERSSVRYAVNTQTNGANAGYNMITKYHNPTFVCLDEPEVRLAAQEKFADIKDVARKVAQKINSDYLIVTLGRKGSIGLSKRGEIVRTPIFSTKVIDTVGAGDAFFAYTVPCVARNMPLDLVSFIGNAVGALAVQIVCNKKPVEKFELMEFIHALLK